MRIYFYSRPTRYAITVAAPILRSDNVVGLGGVVGRFLCVNSVFSVSLW